MVTISLCMIVKNEQGTLEECLKSVRDIVNEIIIVDTGSTDRTREIAQKWTSQVFDFEWIDNFASARNFSFSKATMDYVFWLDADDILLPEDREKLSRLKQLMFPEVDAVSMQYHCDFDIYGNVTLNVRRTRLVKRSKNYLWEGAVHEDLVIKSGRFIDSDIIITHRKNYQASDPERNLNIYDRLLANNQELSSRDLLHYAMELHQHRLYQKAIEFYLRFMDMENITSEDRIRACSRLADCYYYLGERKEEREYIFKTFEFDIPRPEMCCRLGYYFLEKNQFSQAVFWYKLAIEVQLPDNQWAIQNMVSHTWLPHMQLGVCYYQMGNYELSYQHNKMALSYRPNDQNIINNMILLEELMKDHEHS